MVVLRTWIIGYGRIMLRTYGNYVLLSSSEPMSRLGLIVSSSSAPPPTSRSFPTFAPHLRYSTQGLIPILARACPIPLQWCPAGPNHCNHSPPFQVLPAARVEQGKLSGAGTLGKKLSRGRSVSQTGSSNQSSVSWVVSQLGGRPAMVHCP